jgi:beta-galactosidase
VAGFFHKGELSGAERLELADSEWRHLDLLHDWAVEAPSDRRICPHFGDLPFSGVGW